ncbi:hypothetical protein BVRB_5g127090 [Beta vulgaris subsp. vulgaris]|uniref:Transmembrane protein n=1 Tax=Beta vulgaris subsp. vulgaris TaxID=3555 RepID=A0A0J8B836_BETVV|nr:hypothetical protein BVRB_5g127090 [Beta vulgaris subsp. vulgaris]
MATTTTALLPNQEQPQQVQNEMPYPQSVPSNNAWHDNNNNNNNNNNNKGSIGPFFAVISVLAVLAIISCVLGRFWIGKEETPLESINHRGSCYWWLKRRCRRPFATGAEVGGVRRGKVAAVIAPPLADERGHDAN